MLFRSEMIDIRITQNGPVQYILLNFSLVGLVSYSKTLTPF
jgi:hypothetical protein